MLTTLEKMLRQNKLNVDRFDFMIVAVIPAYRCKKEIMSVISSIPLVFDKVIVVDDACPDKTGLYVSAQIEDERVIVLFNEVNTGVGGAVLKGYTEARRLGADVVVKIDGDGQMDPSIAHKFIQPILKGLADYTKGNRFTKIEDLEKMPRIRLYGNLGLSFLNKLSSGYWHVMDPTNGYTAIRGSLIDNLPIEKISKRYFFETDLLFRLGIMKAVVVDIPMKAIYQNEVSNLRISRIFGEFARKHLSNFFKRTVYQYFLLDFNFGSVQLVAGIPLFTFGTLFGLYHLIKVNTEHIPAPTGTIMISVLSIILGFQLILGWLSYDVHQEPRLPLSSLD